MSRIAPLVGNLIGSETADELLVDIMGALGDSAESVQKLVRYMYLHINHQHLAFDMIKIL